MCEELRAFYHTDPRWLVSGLEKQVAAAAFRAAFANQISSPLKKVTD
jgi:hypothetical protein